VKQDAAHPDWLSARDRIRRMVDQSKPSPAVIPISCPHCHQKQAIHVVARAGISQLGKQAINCVKCKAEIDLTVPDQIVGGPFIAETWLEPMIQRAKKPMSRGKHSFTNLPSPVAAVVIPSAPILVMVLHL
jgi:hypothetical protein